MNLPNRLTVTRLAMTPLFFVIFFLVDLFPSFNPVLYAVLLVLFYGVMELTDLLEVILEHGIDVADKGDLSVYFQKSVVCAKLFFSHYDLLIVSRESPPRP